MSHPLNDTLQIGDFPDALRRDVARAIASTLSCFGIETDADSTIVLRPGFDDTLPDDIIQLRLTAFGASGPASDWTATPSTLFALSGGLARSGIKGRPPVLPPDGIIIGAIATQAAFAVLLALLDRERTGEAVRLDISALDMLLGALDPAFGMMGSATDGRAASDIPRGRPSAGRMYPILPCADGHVRLCVLAPRQWQGLFRWLGEPEAFADPSFSRIATRFKSDALWAHIRAFFADKTRREIEAGATAHGVPAAGLRTLDEALAEPQLNEGKTVLFGPPTPARTSFPAITGPRPLSGFKVLDMGVIVVGGDAGRMLADYGADVVKVENPAFPDGSRQTRDNAPMSANFAAGHRNKSSLALDLRSEDGLRTFKQLLEKADVLLSNFKPGTLDGLGLSDAELERLNPALVRVDSSAYGPVGPWLKRLGYGPLVRAACGLTQAWRYRDDPEGFCDSVTVYPDHAAARMSACAALALLVRRARTGAGGKASLSQANLLLDHLALELESTPGTVHRADGDDEWEVRSGEITAPMMRVPDLLDWDHLKARDMLRPTAHPLLDVDPPNLARSVDAPWPDPDNRPAPTLGRDTDAVLEAWLA